MDIALLIVSVLLTGLAEYIAAALLAMPASVINALADEGSTVGARLREALDDPEAARLSVSIIDIAFIVIVSTTAFSVAAQYSTDDVLVLEMGLFILALMVMKTVASFLGARFGDRSLRTLSVLVSIALFLGRPFVFAQRTLMRMTHTESDEEEAREELEALVETAREEGALDAGEYRILTNIMRFSSVEVSDVMTPRTVVFGVSEDTTVGDAVKMPELHMYSRFPIFEGESLDDVTGYVMTKDILRAALAGRHSVALTKLKRAVQFIPENSTLDQALEQFLQQKQHLFMVVDEYGGIEGILTMEDVMETILGAEIVDEADHVVDLRALAKQRRDRRVAELGSKRD
jgi:CBS domain containing-hemolysin-like protein